MGGETGLGKKCRPTENQSETAQELRLPGKVKGERVKFQMANFFWFISVFESIAYLKFAKLQ